MNIVKLSCGVKGRFIECDTDSIPQNVKDHGVVWFMTRCVTDAHASDTHKNGATDDTKFAVAMKKFDALMRGELRVQTESDPLAKEIRAIVIVQLQKRDKTIKLTKDVVDAGVKEMGDNPKIIAAAKARLAALDIDLDTTDVV